MPPSQTTRAASVTYRIASIGVIIIAGLQRDRMREADPNNGLESRENLDNLDNLTGATLDWLTDRILDALERDEQVGPAALQLLLRRYSFEAREDLTEPLGAALARELDRQAEEGCTD